jgi:hypothetical protein
MSSIDLHITRLFQQYFSYIVAVSYNGGGNRSTWRKHRPVASHLQTLSHNVVSSSTAPQSKVQIVLQTQKLFSQALVARSLHIYFH